MSKATDRIFSIFKNLVFTPVSYLCLCLKVIITLLSDELINKWYNGTMSTQVIDYPKLYNLSNMVTPVKSDCGILCGKLCCQPDQCVNLGMYLYPGEEVMFTGKEDWLEWDYRDPAEDNFPPSWKKPLPFIICTKPCPREKRPLNCRFFPLAPHLLRDNTILLIHETMTLPYQCPLITQNTPLEESFIKMVGKCWQILLQDPRIKDLVEMDSRERESSYLLPEVKGIVYNS
jgi:hypothetical protein